MTSNKEDLHTLIDAFRTARSYRPSVCCYEGDPSQPVEHPKGEANTFARWISSLSIHSHG